MSATKQRITDEFERQVGQVGYAKATLDDVARALRISKKTIYVHFDGKSDIYAEVVARQAKVERMRMSAGIAGCPNRRAKLEMLLRMVIGSARAHILETGEDEWVQEYAVAADAFRKAYGDLTREIVAEGIVSGEFAPGDADFAEKMVAAMVLEYLVLVNASPTYNHDEELVERTSRFIG